jgi:hypothetical protein
MRHALAHSLIAFSFLAVPAVAGAHETSSANIQATGFVAPLQADRAEVYWTPARVESAKPMELPELPANRFPHHKK